MKIAGEATLHAPVEKVWEALLDPSVLVATIPGCERLETLDEHSYAMTINAGVAAIRGVYSGTCSLRDLAPHSSLVLSAEGAGAPGTIATDVTVTFTPGSDGTTTVSYDADATVGGMIAGVGQRMLSSVSKRMAGEFFGNVDRVLTDSVDGRPAAGVGGEVGAGPEAAAPAGAPGRPGSDGVFTAPPKPAGDRDEFLKGVTVGAGLVLLGVLAGAIASRRR